MRRLQPLVLCYLFLLTLVDGCKIELVSTPSYRSIISSSSFPINHEIERDQTTLLILFNSNLYFIQNWQIMNSLIPYYGHYFAYLFSISSLFPLSSVPSTMVGIDAFHEDPLDIPGDIMTIPYTKSTLLTTIASINIYNGTELTRPYLDHHHQQQQRHHPPSPTPIGGSSSSSSHNKGTRAPSYHLTNELIKFDSQNIQKYCLTNIEINSSLIPKAGKGVFAKKSFKKGDTITISPIYILPKHEILKTIGTSLLMNYCIVSSDMGSDVALLPATQIAMMNHGGKSYSNVQYQWALTNATLEMLSWNLKDLENEYNPPLDMMYIASRDIAAGEELLIDYGSAWEIEWKEYLINLEKWVENEYFNGFVLLNKPQFRSFITAPDNLFPSHWKDICIGSTLCERPEDLQVFQDNYHKEIDLVISLMKQFSITNSSKIIVESSGS